MSRWDRAGTVTAGSTDYTIYLADRPDAYRERYRLVWPQHQDIPGAEGKVAGDPFVREWQINEWAGGEGNDLWKRREPSLYNKSTNVTPKPIGEGLVLGPAQEVTQHDGAATFTEATMFGIAQGQLWAVRDATAHWWQPSTDNWDETGWATGGTTNKPTSLIDQGDGTNILIGYDAGTDEVRQVSSAANAAVTGLTINYPPILRNWGGTLFHLDGDDLYSFTLSGSTATATLQSDITGRSNKYLTNALTTSIEHTYTRMSTSDKGPIWFQRLDNGQTFIHEYNVNSDTTSTIGKLPVDFVLPMDIFFAHGFYFVAFRYTDNEGRTGDAYIHYFRGAQRGVAGPVRTASSSDEIMKIAGVIGDDLIFYFDGAVWAYNLTTGGIFHLGASTSAVDGNIYSAITFGEQIFLANHDSQGEAERFDRRSGNYTTATATYDSGRYDFEYPGITKALMTVTVVTEPLPTVSVGNATFDVTGGASEDLWTLASHGLSVGDNVRFTAVGTGAEPYLVDTVYWVVAVPDGNTFQLSASDGGAVLEGTGSDSSGTWTLEVSATSVALSVSADGASFTSVTGTHETMDATSFTWTVSSSSSEVTGEDFELRLTLATTDATVTPTIRSITARAVGLDRKRVFQVIPDVVTRVAGQAAARSSDRIADLKTLLGYNGVVQLSHGWDLEDHDADNTYECVITEGQVVDAVNDDDPAVLEFTEVTSV